MSENILRDVGEPSNLQRDRLRETVRVCEGKSLRPIAETGLRQFFGAICALETFQERSWSASRI